jgi:hypothetical protein
MSRGSKGCIDLLPCECGSTELCICSTMPVFIYVSDRKIVRVVVADEERISGGVARCLTCERFWVLDPSEMGVCPAREPGP